MSSPLTVGERIVLHLSRFSRFQEDYDVPKDVSQDGIASALRISRAHAAIEVKKLKDGGEVRERLAHVKRGKSKRKVYFLTPKGEERAQDIREFAESEGIDITPLLDISRCSGEDLYPSLEPELRSVLAQACVFRRPFHRDILPQTSVALLPEEEGMVDMPEELKGSVPPMLEEEEYRRCHSLAADYWLDQGDYRERLHHLLESSRGKEAEMLVSSRGRELMDWMDADLFDMFQRVPVSPRHRVRILRLRAEAALALERFDEARGSVDELEDAEDLEVRLDSQMLKGRILLAEGRPEEALRTLETARDMIAGRTNLPLECEIASALMVLGHPEEAKENLHRILDGGLSENGGEHVGRIYHLLGRACMQEGDPSEAIKILSKGLRMVREENRPPWYRSLAEAYRMQGMKEKAQELLGKIPRTRRGGSPSAYQDR
ncbi:MAG: tetratricopeptide repeat protein [Methanomassiliicoccales archaeon]